MKNNKRPETMERITTKALADAFIAEQVKGIQTQVGDKKVLLALSGGVDSSVVAALLIKAIGKQLVCVHVNHGLLRKGEPEQVIEVFRNQMDANLVYVDAVDRFLSKLSGVADPEKKRKIIGAEFIRVFEEEARKQEGIEFLAQGTIYPDILESDGVKAHHNVGGLPEDLQFALVEPLKFLYKDEVRIVGKALGLSLIHISVPGIRAGHQRPHRPLCGAEFRHRLCGGGLCRRRPSGTPGVGAATGGAPSSPAHLRGSGGRPRFPGRPAAAGSYPFISDTYFYNSNFIFYLYRYSLYNGFGVAFWQRRDRYSSPTSAGGFSW